MIKAFLQILQFLFDFLIPRFITEDVALRHVGSGSDWSEWDSFEIVCAMSDISQGEEFDGIAEADSFTWLWFGISYRIGNFRPWGAQAK